MFEEQGQTKYGGIYLPSSTSSEVEARSGIKRLAWAKSKANLSWREGEGRGERTGQMKERRKRMNERKKGGLGKQLIQ